MNNELQELIAKTAVMEERSRILDGILKIIDDLPLGVWPLLKPIIDPPKVPPTN